MKKLASAILITSIVFLAFAQGNPPDDKPWNKGEAVVTFAWDPSPSMDVTHYGLVFSDVGPDFELNGAKWAYLTTGNVNTQSFTNYFPRSGTYWAACYAVNAAGLTSDLSNVVEFEYKARPLAPGQLKVTGSTTTKIEVPVTIQLAWQ